MKVIEIVHSAHDDGVTHQLHSVRSDTVESMAGFRAHLDGYLCGLGLYFQRLTVEDDPTEITAPEGEYFLVRVSPLP